MDLTPLVTNPLVLGAILTTAVKSIKPLLKKVDEEKLLVPYQKHLHVVFLVLAFGTSALDLGLQGKLQELDMNTVVNFLTVYIPLLVGGKAMDVTLKKDAGK